MSEAKKPVGASRPGARMVGDQAPRLAAPEQRPLSAAKEASRPAPGEQKQGPRATPPQPAPASGTQSQSGGSAPANTPKTTQKTTK